MPDPLWTPSPARRDASRLTAFTRRLERETGRTFPDYHALHRWSVEHVEAFWRFFAEDTGLRYDGSLDLVLEPRRGIGASWFPEARLNFAEHALSPDAPDAAPDDRPALVTVIEEDAYRSMMTYGDLRRAVARCARGLREAGIGAGDRVAGYLAHGPEAVVAALAAASIGATWSSASPDFGLPALVDRFGQIEPALVFASTHYRYKGRLHRTDAVVAALKKALPSMKRLVTVPYPVGEATVEGDQTWADFLGDDTDPPLRFVRLPFEHLLYILFSSGTTGAPKAILHGAGGTLLQHRKELALHSDLGAGDRLLYFTTTGWMMWNWQLSALTLGATIVLYDGNPAYPDLAAQWRTVEDLGVTHFGTSGRFLETCMKGLDADLRATWNGLPDLRVLLYTGSPLSAAGYRWVYDVVKSDVQLAGISGGTDIVSCFVLGNPNLPVYAGEIQCRGLGVDVVALDENEEPVVGEPGELVCRTPLPSMPVGFLNDPGGERYRAAYFDRIPGVWWHGDYVTITPRGGAVIHGRSDATLNPGGVRIGSAELYAPLDRLPEVVGALAAGWTPPGESDEAIVLFVVLAPGVELDETLRGRIRSTIRAHASPRHVPTYLFPLSALPVTRSGKPVELTAKAILAGRPVRNRHALANPEVLDEIEAARAELIDSSGIGE